MHAIVKFHFNTWLNVNLNTTLQQLHFKNIQSMRGCTVSDIKQFYVSQNVDEDYETLVYTKTSSPSHSFGLVGEDILDFATNREYVAFEADISGNDNTLLYLVNCGALELIDSQNSDAVINYPDTIDTLQTDEFTTYLNEFLRHFENNYFSNAALLSLQKTFQSKNITIQEWNTIVEYLKENLSDITVIKNLLTEVSKYIIVKNYPIEQLQEAIGHIEDNYVSLEIASYEPANMRGNRRVWLDTEPSGDEDQIIIPQRVLAPNQINEILYPSEDNGVIIDEDAQSQEIFFDLDEQENFFETEDNGVIIEER